MMRWAFGRAVEFAVMAMFALFGVACVAWCATVIVAAIRSVGQVFRL